VIYKDTFIKNKLMEIVKEKKIFTLKEYIGAIESAFQVAESELTKEEKQRYIKHVKAAAKGWSKIIEDS